MPAERFVAIDFETADAKRDSACALGMVVVENCRIVERHYQLIRPPRMKFSPFCVAVHGLTWKDVEDQPTFAEYWKEAAQILENADFLAAHNAPFDRSVLNSCCQAAGMQSPDIPYLCTVKLSRRTFDLSSNKLPDVCGHLGIELDHHHAASDAEACARIVMSVHERDCSLIRDCL